jgi:hypothetical protein
MRALGPWVGSSWTPAQVEGAPGADRPSHGLGRHLGQHQTRTPHNVRSGRAITQGRRSSPGGILGETPPSIRALAPLIVTAAPMADDMR